ncbi:MAG: hypothetical protein ABJG78_13255 [Cyclobacteriaceae bacterium]
MRTSLIEIEQIENLLLRRGDLSNRLVTEAKALSNPELRKKVQLQSTTYDLVNLYGRGKLREEIKAVEHQLFNTSKYRMFQNRIRSLFK